MFSVLRWPPCRPVAVLFEPKPKLTLGLSETSCRKLRALSGRSTMRLFSITDPTVAFSVVSSGAPPLTSTTSEICPVQFDCAANDRLEASRLHLHRVQTG